MARPPQTEICNRLAWRIIPFFVCFFLTVGVLLGVYRARTGSEKLADKDHNDLNSHTGYHRQKYPRRTPWEEGHTNDRWVIISDDQDLRYVCTVVDVAAELEWRTLVVGNNVTCCTSRKSCFLLTSAKLKMLSYDVQAFMAPKSGDTTQTRRNVAYLYAIHHGARNIFDAYPETYVNALVDVDTFRKSIAHQLANAALNMGLGLVRERPYIKRVHNAYSHFGRADLWTGGFRRNTQQRYLHNHIYRICEVRPPSIEKFLETDDGFFDWAAPALTLPGSTVAPFSSKNTLYTSEAFWGLMLLPASESSGVSAHLLRTIWNQALLGEIAGSLKLSLSTVATLKKKERNGKDAGGGELREPSKLAERLLKWSCPTRSVLACVRHLFQHMHQLQVVSARGLAFVESWISDLQRSHYLEPPIIPRRRGSMNPCLGADGLYGVAFYPALPPHVVTEEQQLRRNATLKRYNDEEALLDALNRAHMEGYDMIPRSRSTRIPDAPMKGRKVSEVGSVLGRHAKLLEAHSSSGTHSSSSSGDSEMEMPLLREFTDLACPGYSQLLPHQSTNPTSNILLIVAMSSVRYDMIPMFEVMYREQFRNILYCGDPSESIDIFTRKYQLSEDRSFSFLPIHTKYTYECVLGAIEMGYNVDGYIMTTDNALINSWNIPRFNTSKLWYGGDYNIPVTSNDWRSLDPGSHKLPRSLDGVLKVLEFLKSALIGSSDDKPSHHHHSKREAEFSARSIDSSKKLQSSAQYNASEIGASDLPKAINVVQLKTLDQQYPSFKYNYSVQPSNDKSNTTEQDYHDLVELRSAEVPDIVSAELWNSTLKVRSSQEELDEEEEEEEEEEDDDEQGSGGEESDEDESDEETERPVSELLQLLLVATRNTSTSEVEPAATNSSTPATAAIHPDHHSSTSANSPNSIEPTVKPDNQAEKNVTAQPDKVPTATPVHTGSKDVTDEQPSSQPAFDDGKSTADSSQGNQQQLPHESSDSAVPDVEETENREKSIDLHVSETLTTLQEIYTMIQENLGVPTDAGYESDLKGAFYGGDRSPYRLNPKTIHHFHCEKGNSLEFCKVSADFLYQLSANTGKDLRLIYDDIPMYFVPKKDQLKFYLLSNLMLQHGVSDEIAIPLIASGLSAEEDWIKLGKSYFGALKDSNNEPTKYPLFDPYAAVLHPADLTVIRTDAQIQKIFCLKYLLRILQ